MKFWANLLKSKYRSCKKDLSRVFLFSSTRAIPRQYVSQSEESNDREDQIKTENKAPDWKDDKKEETQKKKAGRPAQGVVREWESKESLFNTKHTDHFNKDIRLKLLTSPVWPPFIP